RQRARRRHSICSFALAGVVTVAGMCAGEAPSDPSQTASDAKEAKQDADKQRDGQALKLFTVPIQIRSYRLLSMSMDDEGCIWAGAIHRAIHRYDPRRGSVQTFAVPYDLPAASSCICAGKKVYILGETYPKLVIFDRVAATFSEIAYPSDKPNVWYGSLGPDPRYCWFFDRKGSGAIKWDTQTDTPKVIPYPKDKPFPSSGE